MEWQHLIYYLRRQTSHNIAHKCEIQVSMSSMFSSSSPLLHIVKQHWWPTSESRFTSLVASFPPDLYFEIFPAPDFCFNDPGAKEMKIQGTCSQRAGGKTGSVHSLTLGLIDLSRFQYILLECLTTNCAIKYSMNSFQKIFTNLVEKYNQKQWRPSMKPCPLPLYFYCVHILDNGRNMAAVASTGSSQHVEHSPRV